MWITSLPCQLIFQNFMVQDQSNNLGNVPHRAEESGNMQNGSETFRTVPKASEQFGKVRNDSARFRNVPKDSERNENHTLTVREAARMFETSGVARTERSITNWCQPNRQGISRLDCYFDPNERRYYLTPQSVETVIQEEIQKTKKTPESSVSEPVGNVPKGSEGPKKDYESDNDQVKELERENLDLKIANRGKDLFIEQLQKERNGFFDQLLTANHKMGELETKLLQLKSPDAK
jgi:hypothetical protein